MQILLEFHSIVRWLIVLVSLLAVVKFALGWRRGGKFGQPDRALASGFGGLMDLQALLGISYFVWSGLAENSFPAYRLAHAGTMLAAVAVAHLPVRWKLAADGLRYRNTLFAIVGALALVFVGVVLLPQGWLK